MTYKFKVGDKVRHKINLDIVFTVVAIKSDTEVYLDSFNGETQALSKNLVLDEIYNSPLYKALNEEL